MIRFLKSLAILGMALPVSIIAREYIHFFNEEGWKGNDIVETVTTGKCKPIPDSNAKGDCGSSVMVCPFPVTQSYTHNSLLLALLDSESVLMDRTQMSKNDKQDVFCRLYEGSDCSAGQQSKKIRNPGLKSFCYGNVIFRYYKCFIQLE